MCQLEHQSLGLRLICFVLLLADMVIGSIGIQTDVFRVIRRRYSED